MESGLCIPAVDDERADDDDDFNLARGRFFVVFIRQKVQEAPDTGGCSPLCFRTSEPDGVYL